MRNELKIKTPSLGQGTELTVLAPIKPGFVPSLDSVTYKTRAKWLLKALQTGRRGQHEYQLFRALSDAVERVGAIHTLRVAVLEPENKILLSVNFDGAFEAYVRIIWQKASRLLDLIFCNTEDYPTGWDHSFAEWSQWLRSVQVEVPFFYAPPDRTMQDGQLLRMQERTQRRFAPDPTIPPLAVPPNKSDLRLTRLAVPSAERITWDIVVESMDPTSAPGTALPAGNAGANASVRQGMQALAGLYRLADVYPPGTPDGIVLHRAARELMPEFARLQADYPENINAASGGRFEEALAWLQTEVDLPAIPLTRRPPALPADRTPVYDAQMQGGMLSSYAPVTQGCLCLLTFDNAGAISHLLDRLKVLGGITTEAAAAQLKPGDLPRNLAFTADGLRIFGLTEQQLDWLPIEFLQGMAARAGLLGDVRGNHPRRWKLPLRNWPGALNPAWQAPETCPRIAIDAVHAMLQVRLIDGGPQATPPTAPISVFLQTLFNGALLKLGVRPLSLQWMERDSGNEPADHFGFIDGQSTPKFAKPSGWPTYPNQVHLGEALIGHANAADAEASLAEQRIGDRGRLLFNGSYLTIRKLRQNVDVLQQAVSRMAATLDPDVVLAKMMGRWPARTIDKGGRPLLPTPVGDRNDFDYLDDAQARGCPFAAHIRRANPRRTPVLATGEANTLIDVPGARTPRLLRQSMPYGNRLAWPKPGLPDADAAKTVDDRDRGLMFMAYSASIAEQFEVVQRWLAGGNSTGGFSGESDPFLGVPESGRKRYFRFEDGGVVHRVWLDGNDKLGDEPRPIVELQWGAYLLAPSLDGMDYLQEQAQAAAAGRTALPWSALKGAAEIARLRAVEAAQGPEAGALAWKAALEDPDEVDRYTSASVWAAIRARHGGVLPIPYGVLIADRKLVDAVLLDPLRRYTVAGYQQRLEHSIGPIFLGLDDGADLEYQRQATACNLELQAIKMQDAFDLSRRRTDLTLDGFIKQASDSARSRGELRWELNLDARELIDPVLADLCEAWIGISEEGKHFQRGSLRWFGDADQGSLPLYPGWFTSPSRCTFQPLPGPLVEQIAQRQGQGLRRAMTAFLDQFGNSIKAPVTRAVLDQKSPPSTDLAARTLIGVMMGFLPAAAGNLRRVVVEWMGDGSFWTLRAACTGSETPADALKLLQLPLRRTMQARPVPELIWRTAVQPHLLGAGTHAVPVQDGDLLILGLGSAAHQGIETGGAPDVSPIFGGRRQVGSLSPTHACPAYQAAIGAMAGLLYAALARREAMRPGPGQTVLSFEGDVATLASKTFTPPLAALMMTPTHKLLHATLTMGTAPATGGHDKAASGGLEIPGQPVAVPTVLTTASAAPGSLGVLLGVGDSWIRNGKIEGTTDFQRALATLGYDTSGLRYGKEGITLRELAAYPIDVGNDTIYRALKNAIDDAVLDGTEMPRALLISLSGNDIHVKVKDYGAEDQSPLEWIVRPKSSGLPMIDDKNLSAFVDERLRGDLIVLLDKLLILMDQRGGRIPIVLHGYDYPVPDGRDYTSVVTDHSWLYSIITQQYLYDCDPDGRTIMKTLIDALNKMMADLATTKYAGQGVTYATLTDTLKTADYKLYWLNELHPTESGFDRLAQTLHKYIS